MPSLYLQYRPVQTDAPATGAASIGGLNFWCLFERAEIQIRVNKYEYPQRLSVSSGNLVWGSFTNHKTGNYLRHGINITTNKRLSPTFRGNGNTIIVGDSQTSPLPIFPEEGRTSVHRLSLCFSLINRLWNRLTYPNLSVTTVWFLFRLSFFVKPNVDHTFKKQ